MRNAITNVDPLKKLADMPAALSLLVAPRHNLD